jgi:hypothetical protein
MHKGSTGDSFTKVAGKKKQLPVKGTGTSGLKETCDDVAMDCFVGVGVSSSLLGSILLTLVGQIAGPITHLEAQLNRHVRQAGRFLS